MQEILAEDDVPTRSELQRQLGVSLAQIFLDYSHRDVKQWLRSFSIVRESLGATPRDDRSKIDETWSEKQKVFKSHIHHDILALGEEELKQFQTDVENVTEIKLRGEFAEKCHMLEAEKRFAIDRNAKEIHATYAELFKASQEELRKKLRIDWADAEAKHKKELQKAVVRTRMETTHEVLRRLRPQIFHIITTLYNDLELLYRSKRERMIADFNQIMRKRHIEMDARITKVEGEKVKELRIQRHELEMRNITNIIFLVCVERLRCGLQMEALCKYFENRIKSLYELIAKQNETISTMRERITEHRSSNAMLQEKITLITKEFQKFINFAFDSVPEHVDFLLPLDLSCASANEEVAEQEKN